VDDKIINMLLRIKMQCINKSRTLIILNRYFSMEATAPKSNTRRDFLLDIEKNMQQMWEDKKVYQVDAIDGYEDMSFEEKNDTKFFCTFPYPYMNGRLHLGHAYSASK
jgi:leucyl-tRNA synthetase